MEDLSKLPANLAVQLLPPAGDSGDLKPTFVVTHDNGQSDLLLDLDSSSDSSADKAEGVVDGDDHDDNDGDPAGVYPVIS